MASSNPADYWPKPLLPASFERIPSFSSIPSFSQKYYQLNYPPPTPPVVHTMPGYKDLSAAALIAAATAPIVLQPTAQVQPDGGYDQLRTPADTVRVSRKHARRSDSTFDLEEGVHAAKRPEKSKTPRDEPPKKKQKKRVSITSDELSDMGNHQLPGNPDLSPEVFKYDQDEAGEQPVPENQQHSPEDLEPDLEEPESDVIPSDDEKDEDYNEDDDAIPSPISKNDSPLEKVPKSKPSTRKSTRKTAKKPSQPRNVATPVPYTLEAAHEADRALFRMKAEGKPWKEIRRMWESMMGKKTGESTLSVRYCKMKENFEITGGPNPNDIRLLRIKKQVEAQLEAEKWNIIAAKTAEEGSGCTPMSAADVKRRLTLIMNGEIDPLASSTARPAPAEPEVRLEDMDALDRELAGIEVGDEAETNMEMEDGVERNVNGNGERESLVALMDDDDSGVKADEEDNVGEAWGEGVTELEEASKEFRQGTREFEEGTKNFVGEDAVLSTSAEMAPTEEGVREP